MTRRQISGAAWVGRRERQEDAFTVRESLPDGSTLCVLADGMGGHAGGDVASKTAVDHFEYAFREANDRPLPQRLKYALKRANRGIRDRIAIDPSLNGMGCTLVGVVQTRNHLGWVSVGDSPMWRFRKGRLERLNADHSVKGLLDRQLARGEISQSDYDANQRKHALRSALMGGDIALKEVRQERLQPGDRIVLASDGIETLSPAEIAALCDRGRAFGPEKMAETLLRAVREKNAPHQDNTTVVIVDHGAPARSAQPFGAILETLSSPTTGYAAAGVAALALTGGGLYLAASLIFGGVVEQDTTTAGVPQDPAPAAQPATAETATPVQTRQPQAQARPEPAGRGAPTARDASGRELDPTSLGLSPPPPATPTGQVLTRVRDNLDAPPAADAPELSPTNE